jgi:hypothetical protein
VHDDRSGHLFVLLERARADWSPEEQEHTHGESSVPNSLVGQMRFFEHVIEVLDAATGELLATLSAGDTYLMNFVDDGRVVGIHSGPGGEEWPVIFRVSKSTNLN